MSTGEGKHTVRWWIDGDVVCGEVKCKEPNDAPCRQICPEGCESWPCEHGTVYAGLCNAAEWFDNDGVADCYGGESHELDSGPVDVKWTGDYWEWTYRYA